MKNLLLDGKYKLSDKHLSPATERLCQAARDSNIYVVIGINERDPLSMGTLYNSQLFIDHKGNIMGVHRKLVPTLTEKLLFARGDGSKLLEPK